jgi:predicted dehydrogenase
MTENCRAVPIAIVGAGAVTESAHLPAALRCPVVQLVALVDTNIENAKGLRHKYALDCEIAGDLADVITKVGGVVIATPPQSHFALAALALSHDVPVLIEKPMTIHYAEAVELCELAECRGKFVAVGYKSRYYPSVILLKQLLESNFFGEICGFHYESGSIGGWTPVSGYNLDRTAAGGGELISNGTHFIDRTLYWFGDPVGFTYQDDSYGGPEANCKGELRFDNEFGRFSGTFFFSKTIQLKNKFTLDSEKYKCERLDNQTESLTLYPKDNPELRIELYPNRPPSKEEPDYFEKQLEDFVAGISGQSNVAVDGRFAARSVKLIEEMYQHRAQLPETWLADRMVPGRELV